MCKIIKCFLVFLTVCVLLSGGCISVKAAEFSESLYAKGAVLMDGDSGRVLYGKNQDEVLPMASTTKVMTCIIALENAREDEVIIISSNAAKQPDVQLNVQTGEKYYLKDLLFSLMLKSHNDSAVAIAEHVGGSVQGFSDMMNQKAAELGCEDTYFITPNGLDSEDEGGMHSTTPKDLALIMRYAIRNQRFLEITQTLDYSFSDLSNQRIFVIHNANALMGSMEGMLSGKTGFTGNAGYCYVCAVKRDDRTFIVALLACGWPGNKTYKWQDTKKLINYGFDQYHYEDIAAINLPGAMQVEQGIPVSGELFENAYTNLEILGLKQQHLRFLLREDESIKVTKNLPEKLEAPIHENQVIGSMVFALEDAVVANYPIVAKNNIPEINYFWCLEKLAQQYLVAEP